MTATRPGGRPLCSDPADLAAENRQLHRLREQVAAVAAWCDLADERTDMHHGVLHTSTIRAVLATAAETGQPEHQHRWLEEAHPVVSCACGERAELTDGGCANGNGGAT